MCSGGETDESHIVRVTAKCSDVSLNPIKEYNLVLET